MVRRMSLLAAAALFAGVIGARAEDRKPADQPFDDQTFVKTAASSGMHEVAIAKIAVEKATRAEVKKFAEMMIKDHTAANDELKGAAKAANIEVPDKLTDKHQKHLDMFKDYKGTDFDKDYIKHTIADHTEGVALFTKASKEAKSKELKDFATKTLPTIQKHLEEAKKLDK
jgi:putative membrane protein